LLLQRKKVKARRGGEVSPMTLLGKRTGIKGILMSLVVLSQLKGTSGWKLLSIKAPDEKFKLDS
jgi:hypothetical protein